VHRALTTLPEGEQRRPGVTADWKNGPHLLTYRQTGYTFGLVADALGKDEPDGLPSPELQAVCDQLLEASVPGKFKDASASLAVDWTGLETFSRPPPRGTSDCAGPEASWGHRKNNLLRTQDELFYGYYLSAGTMAREENGAAVPELARCATVSSCRHDPVPAFTPVLAAMPEHGIPPGDVLAGSGYSHRIPQHWAALLRAAGARLVQDLHPHDRGPRGHPRRRHHQQRQSLLPEDTAAAAGTGTPRPEHPQACCAQQTITVPPDVLAKTAQKHDYPSAAWRRSYARRTGAERGFAATKDPASNDIARGWCRLMGLMPLMLFVTTLLVVRNQRILTAWNTRQKENTRRAAKGLPPKTQRRRRKTPTALVTGPP
jgi:hypothetical protein